MYIFVCKEERSSVSVSFIFPQRMPSKIRAQRKERENNIKLAQSTEHICLLISAYFMNICTLI